MDKEPQTKAEPAKSTVNTTTTTAVNPSHQANGAPKTPPALTTVTTFHNQPTPTNRKVVQVNLSGDRLAPSFSPSERVNQASSSQQSQKTISLPNTPGSTPLVRGIQNPSTATTARKISPQALLLGKSPSTSQAQMLLRAQMLILTSAVRPDVPALSSSSSYSSSSSSNPSSSSPRFPSTQLQSLTLRPPPPGTLTIPPNLQLKPTTSSQPPPLSCPRLPTFHLRSSQPANAPGKDGASKTESPGSQTTQTKAPVRHLTVPPPSLYAPAQAHALAKQKLNSSGLKRPHSQISIPQHPFNQRHTPPNSPPATPKKLLPELKRCPSTQPSQSVSAQSASVPITVPSPARSHLTPPTLTLPLRSSSPGGSLLATKQLLRIALSSASAQCTNGQSKTATVSPPHDLIQSKPLISPVLAKPECPTQPLRTPNPCPQLVQLSPSRQTTAATPLITTPPLASPQRASPPSPVLPLVSTSSILAPLQSLLTSQSPTQTAETSKEPKDRKEEQKEGDVPQQTPQDLKCPAPLEKITQPVTVDQPSSETTEKVVEKMTVCTEDSRTDSQMKTSQKNETLSTSVAPWPAEKDDQCEEMSTQSDNHSAISSLSSDMSPIQSSITQPLDMSPVDSCFPPKFHPVLERPPVQPPTVSQMKATEAQQPSGAAKPLVLTHLVEGFIIQEGLEPFPVSRSSLMVGPVRESGVNGVREAELIPSSSEPPEDSTDSDDVVTNNGVGRSHKLVLQCQFCKRKGTAQTFPRSKRFCSKSCAKRFSYTKRFRALRRCVSEGGHRSELNGAEESFHQAKHGTTEQWRILQQPPHESEDGTAAPMKTRLRRHTEQEREREIRVRQTVEETRSAPTSPIDPVSPTDISPYPKPAQWSVDQVSSFISNLPGCQDIAESFRAQEIDGQALLLLTEDHLMSAMNVKLGPALKICARINSLKEGGR
ncbi:polyhomeotic-like protein 3 isoform X4 [Onychostoma macrolepis]|nr:polyhomeotic-like protein 3 isoform X4 [Onychostoma macrolepis]XP_058622027.1 polyhomeotic-like protein 3 isoform X4 [Onychostoma macrolepis]XP_058622028.1 polyhomeotic-like protein 3 isoform X4 [Onychostoma macrolepis]XP_058622029.1 polyhomeotic-like protein 3 isoform X4 [Onychostoma macrolepis]